MPVMTDARAAVLLAVTLSLGCGSRGTAANRVGADGAPRLVVAAVVHTGTATLVVRDASTQRPGGAELVNAGATGSTVSPMRWVTSRADRADLSEPMTAVYLDRAEVLRSVDVVLVSDTVMVGHGTPSPAFEDALARDTWYTAYRLEGTPHYLLAGSYPDARMILRSAYPPDLAAKADGADAVLVIGGAYYVRGSDGVGLDRVQ
jgi:hypothetical protein